MKTILITGASDGIGKSIALKLSALKENLVLFGRDETKLTRVKTACEANGSKVVAYAFDLTNDTEREAIVSEVIASQQVDVLINNAGVWHKVGDVTSLSEDKIHEVISLNLTAQILLTRQLLEQMRSRENSVIINIISKSGITAQAGQSVYSATKYGKRGFTDVLREDTKREPIRIGAVYQSGTNTDMFKKAGDDFPVDTFTGPDDLADVVVFMLTRPARLWINEVRVEK